MLETDSLRWLQGYLAYILMAPPTQVAFKAAVSRMVDELGLQEPNTYFKKHQFKEPTFRISTI
ncbi:MAG TPA: hypothetical protein VKA09_17575 [Nitrososphaeraceae archaeon]|nr:hypothetical protein [Nitrososphaeraceae archaeon]